MHNYKIFCIGLNKTGTSSLHKAFEILGFSSVHHVCDEGYLYRIMKQNELDGNLLLSNIDQYDAYSDWAMTNTKHFFKILDKQYPGSKFIYNTRPIEDWVQSRVAHVMKMDNLERLQKEQPSNNWVNLKTDIWRKEFIEHDKAVRAYFKGRENDYLVLDVTNGSDWNELCRFLKLPTPKIPFPHVNKSNSSFQNILKKIKNVLRYAKL